MTHISHSNNWWQTSLPQLEEMKRCSFVLLWSR